MFVISGLPLPSGSPSESPKTPWSTIVILFKNVFESPTFVMGFVIFFLGDFTIDLDVPFLLFSVFFIFDLLFFFLHLPFTSSQFSSSATGLFLHRLPFEFKAQGPP